MPDAIKHHPMHFIPTAAAANAQLEAFLPRAGKAYAHQRNHDFGPENRGNISCLSPYIRHRLLDEEGAIYGALEKHGADADKFITEIFWRGYFKGWLEHHPSVWSDYTARVAALHTDLADNPSLQRAYDKAVHGSTGIACFDAWAQELVTHGYLHNHARMWFASIWIFTLKLPWQLGADFFLTHLLDGDAASNSLSWRWVAGLHTKGKHYLARAENIRSYTGERFAPSGLNETAAPLAENITHPRLTLDLTNPPRLPENYAMLIHMEECGPDSLGIGCDEPRLAIGFKPDWSKSPWSPAQRVIDFGEGAVDDALNRIVREVEYVRCKQDHATCAEGIIAKLQSAGIDTLVVPTIPTGPLKDLWQSHAAKIANADITIIPFTREYDALVWPHASRGFFALKKQIPAIIEELGYS